MEAMISFVDAYRDQHGVEPICRVLAIAPSTYHAHVARRAKPETAPVRLKRDTMLSVEIRRVFDENFQVYGVRKLWRQLLREGYDVARCTVVRLMKKMALQGVIRGRRVRTTVSDKAAPCPLDHVNRRFRAPRPNMLAPHQGIRFQLDVLFRNLLRNLLSTCRPTSTSSPSATTGARPTASSGSRARHREARRAPADHHAITD
jgi:hypothetical protein